MVLALPSCPLTGLQILLHPWCQFCQKPRPPLPTLSQLVFISRTCCRMSHWCTLPGTAYPPTPPSRAMGSWKLSSESGDFVRRELHSCFAILCCCLQQQCFEYQSAVLFHWQHGMRHWTHGLSWVCLCHFLLGNVVGGVLAVIICPPY